MEEEYEWDSKNDDILDNEYMDVGCHDGLSLDFIHIKRLSSCGCHETQQLLMILVALKYSTWASYPRIGWESHFHTHHVG